MTENSMFVCWKTMNLTEFGWIWDIPGVLWQISLWFFCSTAWACTTFLAWSMPQKEQTSLSYEKTTCFSIGAFCCQVGNHPKSSQASYSIVFFVEQMSSRKRSMIWWVSGEFWCWLSLFGAPWSWNSQLCSCTSERLLARLKPLLQCFKLSLHLAKRDLSHWSTKFESPPCLLFPWRSATPESLRPDGTKQPGSNNSMIRMLFEI